MIGAGGAMDGATMVEVPSEAVPGLPRFRCLLPAGWRATEAPGAVVALVPPEPEGATVLVSTSRVAADVDLRDVAVRSFARQRAQHPDLQLDSQRVGRFGDRITYVRAVSLPGNPGVAQIQALFFAPREAGRAVADAVTVIGSCPATAVETFGPTVVDVIASFEFPE